MPEQCKNQRGRADARRAIRQSAGYTDSEIPPQTPVKSACAVAVGRQLAEPLSRSALRGLAAGFLLQVVDGVNQVVVDDAHAGGEAGDGPQGVGAGICG
jgi:hypothetical protein